MIVIGLSDVHGNRLNIERMRDIVVHSDVTLLVGDITQFGGGKETENILRPVIQSAHKVFAVSGNCDYPGVDAYLDDQKVNIHGRGAVHKGIGFVGLGGSLVTPFHTPNELTEEEIDYFLNQGVSGIPAGIPMILVSHQPPADTGCDRIYSGKHVGSMAVRAFIEKYQPMVCFTGHIHESAGVDRINETRIINPGKLNAGRYAWCEIVDRGENRVKCIEIRNFP